MALVHLIMVPQIYYKARIIRKHCSEYSLVFLRCYEAFGLVYE